MQTADFYSSATGTLRVNGGRDENAPAGVSLSIDDLSYIKQGSRANEGSSTGTTDYNELTNKPQINNVTLESNKTAAQLGLATTSDISNIKQVPTVTSSDNNKVLTASYSGGTASYAWVPSSSGGTSDYTELSNKPQINSITLTGNVSSSDIGVQPTIDSTHKVSADNIDDTETTNKFATAAQLEQITTNQNNISAVCDYGGKNIFEPTITSGEYYGLTITVNADNSITISNSTPLTESKYIILGTATPKTAATYTLDGTPSGVTTDTGGYMRIEQGSSGVSQVLSPVDIDLNNTQAYTVFLRVLADKTYDITLKPMLCFKSLYQASSAYEPYAPSNRELYEMIKALQ